MIICIIGLLTLYMGYFFIIDPIFVKWKQNSYRQQKEEEVRLLLFVVFSSVNQKPKCANCFVFIFSF